MPSLTDAQSEELDSILISGGVDVEVFAQGAARLYTSGGAGWEFTGCEGVALILGEGDVYYIRLVSLSERKVIFEQELYEQFEYSALLPFFHCFEMNDHIGALVFADETEAGSFFENVIIAAEELGGGEYSPESGNASAPAMPPISKPPPAAPSRPSPSAPPSAPARAAPERAPSPTPAPAAPVQAASQPTASPASQPPASSQSSVNAGRKKEKKKKGFMKSLKSATKMIGGDSKAQNIELSAPTGFRHESHIGWDTSAGFEIRNIPPEWRKLFQAAGVKKSELKDQETCEFIMKTVSETIEAAGGSAPPIPGGGGGGGGGAPPPPAPPQKASAPPPPPPSMPAAPAAPPPPPAPAPALGSGGSGGSSTGSGGSSGGLLDQIRSGKDLKPVEERPAVDLNRLDEATAHTLVDTLASAMASRRPALVDDDEDDDDDWFDDDDDDDWD